jgi:hypothetical protein
MNIKKIVILSTILLSTYSWAAFKANNWSDDMNDVKIYEQYTSSNGSSIGFRCDIKKGKKKDFMMTFDSRDNVATPSNSKIKIKMRVDSGEVFHLKGRTYSNSYKSGMMQDIPEKLLKSIKQGNKLLVNIYVYDRLELNQNFSLSGSSKALSMTADKCDFMVSSNPELEQSITKLESQRDVEIQKITQKYAAKIKKLKSS